PVPFDSGWGVDRKRLRQLAAGTDAAREPVLGLLTLTRALRAAGNDDLAEGFLRAAARARPQEAVLLGALGQLLEEQKRWPQAVEVYAALRSARPESGVNLAIVLVRSGREKEGLALFERLTQERPEDPSVHIQQGATLYDQGRPREAEAAFRQAIRL